MLLHKFILNIVFLQFALGSVYSTAYWRLVNALGCTANRGVGCGYGSGGAPVVVYVPPAPTTAQPDTVKAGEDNGYIYNEHGCEPTINTTSVRSGLANPYANDKTTKIYSWLKNLEGTKKILSGAFGGFNNVGNDDGFSVSQANEIFATTSKLPAVYGIDCGRGWETTAPGREADLVDCWNTDAAVYGSRAGFIAVSHHLPNPFYSGNEVDGRGALKQSLTNEQFAEILDNGSPTRLRWLNILDRIAKGLRSYRDRGITILYRPLHGMNGECFWWGSASADSCDPFRANLFKRLWIDMFGYFKDRGLDNLIWVYSADDNRSFRSAYYPGDEYVDIVGLALYQDDPEDLIGYREITSLKKPFALTEVGPQTINHYFDYGNLVRTVLKRYPKTTYFMSWNKDHGPLKNEGIWEAYNNPAVVNIGDFDVAELGGYY